MTMMMKKKKNSGAIGNPNLNSLKNGMNVNGTKNQYVIDLLSSLYPSIKIAHNIAPNTLVGKISLDEKSL